VVSAPWPVCGVYRKDIGSGDSVEDTVVTGGQAVDVCEADGADLFSGNGGAEGDLDQIVVGVAEVELSLVEGEVTGGFEADVSDFGAAAGGGVDGVEVRRSSAGGVQGAVCAEDQGVAVLDTGEANLGGAAGGSIELVEHVEVDTPEVAAGSKARSVRIGPPSLPMRVAAPVWTSTVPILPLASSIQRSGPGDAARAGGTERVPIPATAAAAATIHLLKCISLTSMGQDSGCFPPAAHVEPGMKWNRSS